MVTIIPERLHTSLKIVEMKNRLAVAKDFGLWEREKVRGRTCGDGDGMFCI